MLREQNSVPATELFHQNGNATGGKLSLQHVPATCPRNMSSQQVPATPPHNMSPQHVPATYPHNMSSSVYQP